MLGPVITDAQVQKRHGRYFFELENDLAIDGKGRGNIRAGQEFGYDDGREYWDTYIKPIGCGGNGPKKWR